ncbi:hypothetical protein M9458_034392, partial [Cirrhinus mrigala]
TTKRLPSSPCLQRRLQPGQFQPGGAPRPGHGRGNMVNMGNRGGAMNRGNMGRGGGASRGNFNQ